MPPELTPLETRALEMLLDGPHSALVRLREQLAASRVEKREKTGVGFFTHFEVSVDLRLPWERRVVLGDVEAALRGLEDPAEFLLFVDGGRISMLEGFSCGGDPWPPNEEVLRIGYLAEERVRPDWSSLVPTDQRDLAALDRRLREAR